MKTWMKLTAFLLVTALLATADAWAGDHARYRRTLSGVPSVHVLVEELSDCLKQAGLSTATLQTDTELRLRAAGIRVATEEESFSLPGSPYLYVVVTGLQDSTITGRSFGYSAAVEVQFIQEVRLERAKSIRVTAPTWSLSEIVVGPTPEIIRKTVRDLADRFSNAYLAVNPKR